jgi:hypothetical protein
MLMQAFSGEEPTQARREGASNRFNSMEKLFEFAWDERDE